MRARACVCRIYIYTYFKYIYQIKQHLKKIDNKFYIKLSIIKKYDK